MNRKKLLHAFESTATAEGYSFYSASDELISSTTKCYPAMWLSPPQLSSIEGRTHGKATYSVTLHALQATAKMAPSMREQVAQRMEQELLDLFTTLSKKDFVISVEELAIRHSTQTIASHDKIALTATADIITFF